MNQAKLHFVLSLQLAELRSENGGVVRFGEMRGRCRGADGDVASIGGLTQRQLPRAEQARCNGEQQDEGYVHSRLPSEYQPRLAFA